MSSMRRQATRKVAEQTSAASARPMPRVQSAMTSPCSSAQREGRPTRVINSLDPSQMVMARITVQSGTQFHWHNHPGPVLVNVTQGELTYVQASDCVPRCYSAGTAFIDPGRGNVHNANGATDGETILMEALFEVPSSGPDTIAVVPPDDCDL